MATLFRRNIDSLASCFLPPEVGCSYNFESGQIEYEKLSTTHKVVEFTGNFFKGLINIAALPITGALSIINALKDKIVNKTKVVDEEELTTLLAGRIKKKGFSGSMYQDSGHGTEGSKPSFRGECDWNPWYKNPKGHIIGTTEDFEASFRNLLDYPEDLIDLLKDIGADVYRFSIERSVIQPDEDGEFDPIAVQKYLNFCKALKENGIDPWVTINHFVVPKWFHDNGGIKNPRNIAGFVDYSCNLISTFKPYVTNWMTFNEVGIEAFQKEWRKVYPSLGKHDMQDYIDTTRNILLAHFEIHNRISMEHPEIKLGITHQWLRFVPKHSWNLAEVITCYFFTNIIHSFIYNSLKTGNLQLPFILNERLWKKKVKPFNFIGVQYYGPTVLNIWPTYGNFPGRIEKQGHLFGNLNFTIGATCHEGERVSRFGPAIKPEDLEDVLIEAKKLGVPLAITEIGCDAISQSWDEEKFNLNLEAQRDYFQRIFQILNRYKLEALFIWTLFQNLEWDSGVDTINLNLVTDTKDGQGRMKNIKYSQAAEYIKTVFQRTLEEQKRQIA